MRWRRAATLGTAAALALAVSLSGPIASAGAHAQLEGTVPAQGSLLQAPPKVVEFRFGEDVEANFGAVRIFGPGGARVDEGGAFHPNGNGSRIAARLTAGPAKGAYTAVYRVISADGHPVSGGVVFYVGTRGAAPKESVAQLSKVPPTGLAVDAAVGIGRLLQFLAIALGVGAVLFHFLVSLRALDGDADREGSAAVESALLGLVWAAALLGLIGVALGIWGQTALAGESNLWTALDWASIRETVGTRFGTVLVAEAIAWLAAAALAKPALESTVRWWRVALSVPLAFLICAPALGGHAATEQPIWLFAAASIAHVAAVSFWAGGVITLWVVTGRLVRSVPSSAAGGASLKLLARFSPLALYAVAVVLASGIVQSLINISAVSQLVNTPYGRAVLIKIVLFVLLVAAGAWQRRRGIPGLERASGSSEDAVPRVRRVLVTETAVVIAVLVATAALASYAPASTALQAGPVSRTATSGPIEVQMTVDPSAVGVNQIHIYLLDAKTGAQFTGSKSVSVAEKQADQGVGPLTQTPQPAGPGHYIVPAAQLPVKGNWTVTVTVLVSAFDQYETSFSVPVR